MIAHHRSSIVVTLIAGSVYAIALPSTRSAPPAGTIAAFAAVS